jgi:hypothetical protein
MVLLPMVLLPMVLLPMVLPMVNNNSNTNQTTPYRLLYLPRESFQIRISMVKLSYKELTMAYHYQLIFKSTTDYKIALIKTLIGFKSITELVRLTLKLN